MILFIMYDVIEKIIFMQETLIIIKLDTVIFTKFI